MDPITGAIVGGAVSGIMGGMFGGSKSPTPVGPSTEEIMGYAKPWTGGGTAGEVIFGDGQFAYGMSPEQQELYDRAGKMYGLGNIAGNLAGYQTGLGQQIISPFVGQFGGIGSGLLSSAAAQQGALTSYDPSAMADEYFTKYVQPGLQKSQERQMLANEARLLSQGRLGSTGGALQQEALAAAQGDVTRQAQADAFAQAQNYANMMQQRQLADIQGASGIYGLGQQALGAGLTGYGQQANIYNLGLTQQRGLLTDPLQAAQMGANLGLGMGQLASGYTPTYQAGSPGLGATMASSMAGTFGTSLGNSLGSAPSYSNNFNLPSISGSGATGFGSGFYPIASGL